MIFIDWGSQLAGLDIHDRIQKKSLKSKLSDDD
jgi:hypothetical protein